jgi:cysteine synthase A
MRKVTSVLDLMCDTPVVRLRGRAACPPRAELWAKLELAMPGQMKDRVALQAILDAEARGDLQPGGVIVESSSGTMAEGLARVGTLRGYRVIIVTDPRIDAATSAKLRALGAELDVIDHYHPSGGWQRSRLERLHEILGANPGALWPQQYDTPSNPGAYEDSLARELVEAFGDRLVAIVASVGSGGSLCGTARGIRKRLSHVRVVAVDAVGSVQFNQPETRRRQSGHGNSLLPTNIRHEVIDEVHWIGDGEAYNACRELARREGVFAGGSSGAAYVAASWVAQQYEPEDVVAVIFPDRGDRYFATIYSDEYMEREGLTHVHAGAAPKRIRYGVDVATEWSYSELPHDDGDVDYVAEHVERSDDMARAIGLLPSVEDRQPPYVDGLEAIESKGR